MNTRKALARLLDRDFEWSASSFGGPSGRSTCRAALVARAAGLEPERLQAFERGHGTLNADESHRLRTALEEVLPTDKAFNDYEVIHDFPDLGRRVMLLNGRRLRIYSRCPADAKRGLPRQRLLAPAKGEQEVALGHADAAFGAQHGGIGRPARPHHAHLRRARLRLDPHVAFGERPRQRSGEMHQQRLLPRAARRRLGVEHVEKVDAVERRVQRDALEPVAVFAVVTGAHVTPPG